jgi:hypothetical protein
MKASKYELFSIFLFFYMFNKGFGEDGVKYEKHQGGRLIFEEEQSDKISCHVWYSSFKV